MAVSKKRSLIEATISSARVTGQQGAKTYMRRRTVRRWLTLGMLMSFGCGRVAQDEPGAGGPNDSDGLGGEAAGVATGGAGEVSGGTGGVSTTGGSSGSGGLTGGTGASGGTGGSGGGEVSTGGVVGLGEPCGEPGALACAGHHQTTTLICDGQNWIFASLCQLGEEACDSSPGVTLGSCQPILAECEEREPGASFCGSVPEVRTCGPDKVTVDVTPCAHACHEGACDDRPNFCPNYEYYNCGTECGEVNSSRCVYSGECLTLFSAVVGVPGTYPVRLPASADACYSCENGRRYVHAYFATGSQKRKITTTGSWRLGSITYPCEAQDEQQCLLLTENDPTDVILFTDAVESEEREIVLEVSNDVDFGCP